MPRTLLALFAHPDDETFVAGGTLAYYARQGVQVVLGCATRGEAGIVHDKQDGSPEDMGQVREEELRCACRILGIQDLRFLGYRDSGMAGSPDNEHPQALIRANPEEVVTRILDLFRQFRPQVILTFGPGGGSGHPDHVAMHHHVTTAWRRAQDAQRCPDLSMDPPRKLYYNAFPREQFRQLRQALWERGLLPEPPSEEEINHRGIPEDQVTTTIAIHGLLQTKFEALRCHRTQVPESSRWMRLPEDIRQQYLNSEHFTLAVAPGLEIAPGETDLFAGLD